MKTPDLSVRLNSCSIIFLSRNKNNVHLQDVLQHTKRNANLIEIKNKHFKTNFLLNQQ